MYKNNAKANACFILKTASGADIGRINCIIKLTVKKYLKNER